jgi:hypothetical protein
MFNPIPYNRAAERLFVGRDSEQPFRKDGEIVSGSQLHNLRRTKMRPLDDFDA